MRRQNDDRLAAGEGVAHWLVAVDVANQGQGPLRMQPKVGQLNGALAGFDHRSTDQRAALAVVQLREADVHIDLADPV